MDVILICDFVKDLLLIFIFREKSKKHFNFLATFGKVAQNGPSGS